jgi:hypothetical protein
MIKANSKGFAFFCALFFEGENGEGEFTRASGRDFI